MRTEYTTSMRKMIDDVELTLLIANHKQVIEKNTWYQDTTASNSGDKSKFVEIEQANGHVTFGDESKVPVKRKGKILILSKDESHQFISNVYYVPTLKIIF